MHTPTKVELPLHPFHPSFRIWISATAAWLQAFCLGLALAARNQWMVVWDGGLRPTWIHMISRNFFKQKQLSLVNTSLLDLGWDSLSELSLKTVTHPNLYQQHLLPRGVDYQLEAPISSAMLFFSHTYPLSVFYRIPSGFFIFQQILNC